MPERLTDEDAERLMEDLVLDKDELLNDSDLSLLRDDDLETEEFTVDVDAGTNELLTLEDVVTKPLDDDTVPYPALPPMALVL